jgi:hypothetical protein
LKLAWEKMVHKTLSQKQTNKKNLSQKRAGGVAYVVGPEFKLQYCKKKKKKGTNHILT